MVERSLLRLAKLPLFYVNAITRQAFFCLALKSVTFAITKNFRQRGTIIHALSPVEKLLSI